MELITQLVESRLNGQESTAAPACLLAANIQASIEGRGRALDNVFCERLWRSVKYENIYLNQYDHRAPAASWLNRLLRHLQPWLGR